MLVQLKVMIHLIALDRQIPVHLVAVEIMMGLMETVVGMP